MEKVNGNPIYTVIVCSKIELKTYERIKSDGTIIRVPPSFGFVVLGSHDVFGFHWVFKYNRDTDEYIQIDEPEILKDTSNITWQSRWCD